MFSGTGDMFAALMLVRLREAVSAIPGLGEKASWISDDEVLPQDLPCAKAAERALASMQVVLVRTKEARDAEVGRLEVAEEAETWDTDEEKIAVEKARLLTRTKAAEVRLVRNLDCLREPEVKFFAEKVDFERT